LQVNKYNLSFSTSFEDRYFVLKKMPFLENLMERVNLQEKRNTYASVSAGILVSINIDNDVIVLYINVMLYFISDYP
jgi:hypothetical protein